MARFANGVLARSDGAGDGWAGEHRRALPAQCLMQDLDAVAGVLTFGTNGVDRLFAEYVPDDYAHRNSLVRKFGVVALFDRKTTVQACEVSAVSTAFYLHMARTLSAGQPVPVRFFFVVGQQAPWQLVEVNVETAERMETTELAGGSWEATWRCLGLVEARKTLQAWLGQLEAEAEVVEVEAGHRELVGMDERSQSHF